MLRLEDIKFPLSPSPEDTRDFDASLLKYSTNMLPTTFRSPKPTAKNQGKTSMCVAFAIASIKEIQEMKERGVRQLFSPAYIYGIRDGWFEGEGMYLRDALKDLRRYGICKFEDFPMIDSFTNIKSALNEKLHVLAPYAVGNSIKSFARLKTTEEIKRAIMDDGAVLMGLQVYPSFYYPVNGVIQPLKEGEKSLGGHGMVVYGWDVIDGQEYWVSDNTWGELWGDKGTCYIPIGYKPIYEMWSVTDSELNLNNFYKIIMYIGDPNIRAIKNDVVANILMDTAPFIKDGRTFVPLSFISRMMEDKVEWIPEYKCVVVERSR